MSGEQEIVQTLNGLRLLRKWQQTLAQARKLVVHQQGKEWPPSVRLHSLKAIRRPVFILGCPRSGTTFLGQVLEALPGVTYYFEPPAMKYYSRLVYQKKVTLSQTRRFYRWGLRALLLAAPGKGPRIVEKNPTHTWIAEDLYKVFPDALFIIINRDGRDVSVSLAEKPWHRRDSLPLQKREPGGYLYGPYPHFYIEPARATEYLETSDLHRCIWIWRRHCEETERLKTALPQEAQCRLSYEELIRRPEETVERVLTFIGETDAESRARVLEAAEKGHSASIGRWRDKLRPEDLAVIESEAGGMLRMLGYD